MHSPSLRSLPSEKRGSKSSSMLGVPSNIYSIDTVDYSTTTDDWTMVDFRHKSESPPSTSPSSPPPIHGRTSSFDLHSINLSLPTSSKSPTALRKAWRSISAQPDLETDTTPLMEFTDSKQHESSLQRRGAIKRSSTKNQQNLSNSSGKGDKNMCPILKTISKSSTDLREIDTKSNKSQKKPPSGKRSGYWISMMDGFQRILMFTPQYSVVKNCEKANRLNFDALEVNFTLKSVLVTFIDNNTNREVLLLSISP